MDPLSIIAGVVGIVGFAASSTANLLSLIESIRGSPAAVRGTGRDASEFLAILNNLKELLNDETLKRDETVQNVFRSLESPIRTSQAALDELIDLIERYTEPSGKANKWNGLKWAFKDENNVKALNDRLVMSKTTLAFALTTINTLNSMRLNKTQGLISDQIRDLRLDLEVKELSSVRPRQGSESRGTEVGFALQRFLNDTSEVVQSPIGAETWVDCNDAITSSFYDDSIFPDNRIFEDRQRSTLKRSETLWVELAETSNIDEADENGDTLLHRAADAGDADLVRGLLDRKAIVDVRDSTGTTPLGNAAWKDYTAVARILLEHGANINAVSKDQHTPCHHAAEEGNTTILKFLIDNGADLKAREEDGWTPLYLACVSTRLGTAKMLITAGSDITIPATDGTTCLHAAALEGSASLIELLLESGADLGARDLTGATALHKAVKDDSLKATIVLLEKGADIEAADSEGRTPLWVTAEEPSVQCARLLLEKGAKVDARNSNGETPLAAAASRGHEQVARILLEFGADVNTKDSVDHTPLHHAVQGEQTTMVQLLIDKGADLNAVNRFLFTPLHLAVNDTYSQEIVSLLYEHGANLNNTSVVGDTPLTTVLRSEDERQHTMALHLLRLGADPDIRGVWKKAPMHWAAEKGLEEVVKALLEKGADRNILDEFGSSPIHFAAKSGHIKCLRLLACEGTNLEIADKDHYTALWKAVMNNDDEIAVEMVHILHAAGASIEGLENTYGKTPLVWAAEKGYRLIVQALLDHSPDVSARDRFGMTAIHYAAENGHLEIVKNLLDKGSDLAWRTYYNQTPMWKAYIRGQKEVVAFLVSVDSPDSVLALIQDRSYEKAANIIRSGASRTVTWEDNRVALHFAAQQGAFELVRLLLDQNNLVDPQDNDGCTPLLYALQKGHVDVAKLLLDHGDDLNEYRSWNLLFVAVKGNHTDCVSLLLASGIDVNVTDDEGQSTLHLVCNAEKEHLEMAKWLLDHGARPDLVDAAKMTPRMLAKAKEHDGILRILDLWELKKRGKADDKTVPDFAKNKDLNKRRFARRDNVEFEMLGRPTW